MSLTSASSGPTSSSAVAAASSGAAISRSTPHLLRLMERVEEDMEENAGKKKLSGLPLLGYEQATYVLQRRFGDNDLRQYFEAANSRLVRVGWQSIVDELSEKWGISVTVKQLTDMCIAKRKKYKERLEKAARAGAPPLSAWPFHDLLERLLGSEPSDIRTRVCDSALPNGSSPSSSAAASASTAAASSASPPSKKRPRSPPSLSHPLPPTPIR